MFVAFAICVTLTILCGDAANIDFITMDDQKEATPKSAEYSTKTRKKRMVPLISKAVAALTKILSKSKGVAPYKMYTKNYMKRGNYLNAIQDFETFGPTHIKNKKTHDGIVIKGQAEGFQLKITSPGYNSAAVLEITEYGTKKGDPPRIYNIMYIKKNQMN